MLQVPSLQRENVQGEIRMCPSGKYVKPMAMRPEDFDIVDIAHHLSRLCRYNGGTAGYLSVAEHCVKVSQHLIDSGYEDLALEGLMHDLFEAYGGDIVNPLKSLPAFAFFRRMEARAEAVAAPVFKLAYDPDKGGWPEQVHIADKECGRIERLECRDDPASAMHWEDAKALFLLWYQRLRRV